MRPDENVDIHKRIKSARKSKYMSKYKNALSITFKFL